jgi:hypothetical protein
VPLPTPAFAILGHPLHDVVYALGFFGDITPIQFDRATGMLTMHPPVPAPMVNAGAVEPHGNALFVTDFNGTVCQYPLNQGLPAGPPRCTPPPRPAQYHRIRFAPN